MTYSILKYTLNVIQKINVIHKLHSALRWVSCYMTNMLYLQITVCSK